MIIPIIIYGVCFLAFYILLEKEKKGPGLVVFLPTFAFGSIINLILLGITSEENRVNGLPDTFKQSKLTCNGWFFNFIKGGEDMLGKMIEVYFQHPIAFIILIVVSVWAIKTIIQSFKK